MESEEFDYEIINKNRYKNSYDDALLRTGAYPNDEKPELPIIQYMQQFSETPDLQTRKSSKVKILN